MQNLNEYIDRAKEFIYDLKNKKMVVFAAVLFIAVIAIFFLFASSSKGGATEKIDTGNVAKKEVREDKTSPASQGQGKIYVDIGGEVKNPGVYEVQSTSRICDLVKMAGGLTDKANTDNINQAEKLTDGQKIMIPSDDDVKNEMPQNFGNSSEQNYQGISDNQNVSDSGFKININTSDATALQEIPGIGPSKAEKIIMYRNSNGSFKSIEDITNVDGIGEKTFQKIKEHITI